MFCPRCSSGVRVKNGFIKGIQRYRCQDCGCNYTRSDRHGKPMKQKVMAVALHLSGISMNSIAAFMGVSAQTVMRWVRWAAAVFAPVPEVLSQATALEMDEMHHFLLKKVKSSGFGKCWIMQTDDCAPGSLVIVIP